MKVLRKTREEESLTRTGKIIRSGAWLQETADPCQQEKHVMHLTLGRNR